MNVTFDVRQVDTTEFGVGQRLGQSIQYFWVPIDNTVRGALRREAELTLDRIAKAEQDPPPFDPAEKYAGHEYLVLPVGHELAASLVGFHEANNLSIASPSRQTFQSASCYFLRGTDSSGRRLTAINRAAQFKSTLGQQGRLMTVFSDALHVVDDPIMQLNAGFDIVIDSEHVHILHPSSFRALADVDDEIAQAVPRNVAAIASVASFVNWNSIEQYATDHPRAASLLASIRTQEFAVNIDRSALTELCASQGILLDESSGNIEVDEAHLLGFLEVLDRRRYQIGLVPNTPEHYKASSRTRVVRGGTP